jgi:hypothetical protein
MQIHAESTSVSSKGSAFALSLDAASIIQKVTTVREAWSLPPGAIIGDLHGGLTFTDVVANALETRSSGGWQEWKSIDGATWTIIILNR